MKRNIIFYGWRIVAFMHSLNPNIQNKIEWTLELLRTLDQIPSKYLKHLVGTKGLYEIRVDAGTNAYRLFCFFDHGNLIVVISGFSKKQQKTPRKEIDQALKLKMQYHEAKK